MIRILNCKKNIIFTLFLLFLDITGLYADSIHINPNDKIKISKREILWGISHPIIANKTLKITSLAMNITDSIEANNILSDRSGGNLDAFKHAIWMALLSQHINSRKARRIGIIHEKINYREYKRGNSSQDSAASLMDLKNNEVGIYIYENNKSLSRQDLVNIIIEKIKNGELYRIKKDEEGEYLDCNNRIIDIDKEKGWNKRKCIIKT